MHRWAIPVAIAAAIWIVSVADGRVERATALIFGVTTVGLYVVSAAAHHRVWEPARLHFLFQLDHSMIMIFFSGTTAPIALVAVGNLSGWVLFSGMLVGTALGVTTVWLPFHPPRGFMNSLFLALGWWPILFSLALARGLGLGGMLLLLGGGALYTTGAIIVGSQKPDPNPNVFGYHEIWHVFVILANLVHYILVWLIVTGRTPL